MQLSKFKKQSDKRTTILEIIFFNDLRNDLNMFLFYLKLAGKNKKQKKLDFHFYFSLI